MTRKIIFIIAVVLMSATASMAETLTEKKFRASGEAEAVLELKAHAPGSDWGKAGSEAATVTIYVDGRYHQDLILFAGAESFNYRVLLGRVSAGEHTLRVDLNRRLSASRVPGATIESATVRLVNRSDPDFEMIAHAPILYARPDTIGRFSDVPLLNYCETFNQDGIKILRYTTIISNEDGGTQTSALMARWGRTTDIEWVNEVHLDPAGKVVKAIYQGIKHETKDFRGRSEAAHPLLAVASENNNFADDQTSEVRFALLPIAVDLSRSSREEIMDRHPWIYRVMAEEMIREGKITNQRTLGARIADLRNYLYLDASSEQKNGAALSFAVKLKGDPTWYTSDLGIGSYKIDRSGYFRTTIRLPEGSKIDRIERIAARCDLTGNPRSPEEIEKVSSAQCDLGGVNKIFLLDGQFQPGNAMTVKSSQIRLPHGEMIVLQGDCTSVN